MAKLMALDWHVHSGASHACLMLSSPMDAQLPRPRAVPPAGQCETLGCQLAASCSLRTARHNGLRHWRSGGEGMWSLGSLTKQSASQGLRMLVQAIHGDLGGSDLQEGSQAGDGPQVAIILEVEGVMADVHKFGHRVAFNKAFKDFGLDCATWSPTVYSDLLRQAGGNEETMLRIFFQKIGWPTMLPTAEQGLFVTKLLQAKHRALEEAMEAEEVPLRPGLEGFLDEASAAGVPVAVITAYAKCGEAAARSLVKMLGPERAAALRMIGVAEVEASEYGQVVLGGGASGSLLDSLASQVADAVATEKQRLAEEVARQLNVAVELDTGSSKMSQTAVASLRAAAEAAGVPAHRCIVLAGSHSGLQATCTAGMPCVVLRSSITTRAEFPQARATMDGLGPGALTVARLLRLLQQPSIQSK